MGFWVASTMKGRGTLKGLPSMVTCCSCMTSSRADWVLAGARLISSASSRCVKAGPWRIRKLSVLGS